MLALRRVSLAVLCLLGLNGMSWAQKVPEAAKANSAGLQGAAASAGGALYAGEAVVVKRLDTQYDYAADGTGSRQITMAVLLQTEAAVRQFGVVIVPFAGNSEHVEIDYVRVRRPDGTTVDTPVTDALELPAPVTQQAPLYSDLKQKQIPVRSLRVGDQLEYKVRIVSTKAEAPGHFWGEYRMTEGVVVLAESLELRFPKGKEVTVWSPSTKPVVTEESGEKIYRWTNSATDPTVGKQAEAKKEADKKRTLTEAEQLDRTEGKLPSVAWTTFKNWDDVGAWYRGLEADRVVADADVKAKVAELIAGKTTDDQKIQAIYTYVATQIRYIGVDLGVGRYQPHMAGEVLRNQYGDCKDKHTLLAAMLNAAGVRADAVLIGANVRFNPDVPSPGAFNHVITVVPENGETIWLDSTQEIAPYRVLLSLLRDKQALVVPMTGVAQVERTPAGLPFTPFNHFDAKATLDKNGVVTSHIAMTLRGDDEVAIRAVLRQISPGQYDDFAQRFSQGLGFGGTTSHAEITRPDATVEPLRIAYDYTRDKPGDWATNYRIVPEFLPAYLPILDEQNPPQVPIDLGLKRVETVTTEMKLPDGWGATLPDPVHAHSPFVNFDKTYRFDHGTLYADRKIEILQEKIPDADWKQYKKFTDDASLADGENYVMLTSTVKKAGEEGPPLASTNNEEAASLVSQATESVHSGDLEGAGKLLDQAKKLNDKQTNLWSIYGYIAAMQGAMTEATVDFKTELDIHPDELRIYLALAQAQMMTGKRDAAKQTLQAGLAQAPNFEVASMLAPILDEEGAFVEEAKMLEPVSAKQPDNTQLQVLLGSAEMKAGRVDEGSRILVALLKDSTDAAVLNDASYALADKNMDLGLAEASALKALAERTKESTALTIDTDPKAARAQVQVLAAVWDTVGWIYFREHKLDAAEDYLRAAWLSYEYPETGLHLGQVQEARGQINEALATYDMARAAGVSYRNDGPRKPAGPIDQELSRRIDALRHKGTKSKGEASTELQGLRKLRIGPAEGRSGTADYTVLMEKGHVDTVKGGSNSSLHGGDEMVKRVVAEGWWPRDSDAKMLRQGILNCHSGMCEFVMLPM